MEQFILAIDQGTTSSRSILFDRDGDVVNSSQKDFNQIFPKSGWVEHDPDEIFESQLSTIKSVLDGHKISPNQLAGVGITNQRETTIVWDRETSQPVYNAIVWQDRRTADYCQSLIENGISEKIKKKTGLVIDAYFSASKIKWILDHVPNARERANEGKLCFGTVDTWLVWKLTKGSTFITDVTNASRTMLYNIHDLEWDAELLKLFDIPKSMLPEVRSSSEIYGYIHSDFMEDSVAISGIAGDQQAALFGQLCTSKGMAKNTYGTGCFLLMNTGTTPVLSKNNLLTTIAWQINGETFYALEGSVFVGGAAVQWIRDGLEFVEEAKEIESLAKTVEDSDGVVFVPALTGLGAPYWDPYARGAIFGLSRGTTQGHIARATLEGIAFQVYDIVKAMEEDSGVKCEELRVDGGASANNLLLQFQSDVFGFDVLRPKILESTAKGAAYLSGLAVGFWDSVDSLQSQLSFDAKFSPTRKGSEVNQLLDNWHKAVDRTKNWSR